jgi:hypothetical protein
MDVPNVHQALILQSQCHVKLVLGEDAAALAAALLFARTLVALPGIMCLPMLRHHAHWLCALLAAAGRADAYASVVSAPASGNGGGGGVCLCSL